MNCDTCGSFIYGYCPSLKGNSLAYESINWLLYQDQIAPVQSRCVRVQDADIKSSQTAAPNAKSLPLGPS